MSDADLDLEALFDEISATSLPASTAASQATPAVAAAASPAETADASAAEDQSDKPMYARLGGIVRMLHDSMR
jgi:chemotaxis protein CheZ